MTRKTFVDGDYVFTHLVCSLVIIVRNKHTLAVYPVAKKDTFSVLVRLNLFEWIALQAFHDLQQLVSSYDFGDITPACIAVIETISNHTDKVGCNHAIVSGYRLFEG